jgi:hypothetical protein
MDGEPDTTRTALIRGVAAGAVLIGVLVALTLPEGVREVSVPRGEAERAAADFRAANPELCDESGFRSTQCEPFFGPIRESSPISVARILAVVVAVVVALALLAFAAPRERTASG